MNDSSATGRQSAVREVGGRRFVSILAGVGLAFALHVLQGMFVAIGGVMTRLAVEGQSFGLASAGGFLGASVFVIGVTQLVYIVPAIIAAFVWRLPGVAQGLIIGAVITFLPNAACFGVMLGGMIVIFGSGG